MVKLFYQYWGSGVALGIAGSKDEVNQTANQLFNHGAVDGELIWMNERPEQAFGYVITTKDKLRAGYESIYLTGQRVKRYSSDKLQKTPMRNRMKTVARLKSELLLGSVGDDESLDKRLTALAPKIPLVNFVGMGNKEDSIFSTSISADNSDNEE